MRILIVDDNDIALELLEKPLVQAGHIVDVAKNGQDALKWVRKGMHRMIISDWDMPGVDGISLCRQVRELSSTYVYFILVTGHYTTADIVKGISAGADDFISKPFNPALLLIRVHAGERLLSLESRDMAIVAMAKLIESRDAQTGQQLDRARKYAQLLAQRLMKSPKFGSAINDTFVRLIYDTTPLHDIGKAAIPDNILLKPGKLTPEEVAIIQTHTTLAKAALDSVLQKYPDSEFLRFACDVVGCHHERFDGTGYPEGLAGDQIPLCARIVAVADVYDALTTARMYRPAMSCDEAKQIIVDGSGSQFDPDVVEVFNELEPQFKAIYHALTDGGASAPGGRIGSPAIGENAPCAPQLATT